MQRKINDMSVRVCEKNREREREREREEVTLTNTTINGG